jgi:AbrB family looped-hinge helix DNA binding protein
MENKVTVTSRGMVTIPAKLRKKLDIRDGDEFIVREHDLGLLYIPLIDIEKLFGVDSKKTSHSIIKGIYEDRRKERKKKNSTDQIKK